MILCPFCKKEIESLDYNCFYQGIEHGDFDGNRYEQAYKDEEESLNKTEFCCYECGEIITDNEYDAKRFLNGEIIKNYNEVDEE